ncbi:MAG TPA: chemotaxis protein CheD [Alphaproteobacteria bacterium]|nr:chemotaxis protein CheD [Alphaproteobacteria bacterium]USO05644.1 MAG: chemotaxis protein CheD [Rhodospirillales bacterium]HOO82439.1 chemotaxis protein CheD [Alphaproteobacteria bacterium]
MSDRISSETPEATSSSYEVRQERRLTRDQDAYFNAQFDAVALYVEPGSANCTVRKDEMLVATVGSGVLLAIYDPELKVGAMGYVMLPDAVLEHFPFLEQADRDLVLKAFEPIEKCIGELKRRGAAKNRIRIRLFGGSSEGDDPEERGLKNTVFVQEYIFRKGLQVLNADIGGPFIRRVHFFPATGRAVRRLLKRKDDFDNLHLAESDFNKKITIDT